MPRRRPHPRSGAAGMRTPPERLQSAMARPAGARGETDLPPPKLPRAGLRSLEASKFEERGTMQVGLPQVRSISRLEIGKKKKNKKQKKQSDPNAPKCSQCPCERDTGLGLSVWQSVRQPPCHPAAVQISRGPSQVGSSQARSWPPPASPPRRRQGSFQLAAGSLQRAAGTGKKLRNVR